MKLFLLCTEIGLIPVGDEAYEEKKKLRLGVTYRADISVPRNLLFHRKYFAMLKAAWVLLREEERKNFRSEDNFRLYVQMCAGFVEPRYDINGEKFLEVPKSISFSSMDEAEFSDLYNKVGDVVLFLLLQNGVTEEQLNDMIHNFL